MIWFHGVLNLLSLELNRECGREGKIALQEELIYEEAPAFVVSLKIMKPGLTPRV